MGNNVRKLRSSVYDTIIEVKVPSRFYWVDGEYDGLEFGPFNGLTRHERGLVSSVLDQLSDGLMATRVLSYLRDRRPKLLADVLKGMDAEEIGVPKEYLDAFDE